MKGKKLNGNQLKRENKNHENIILFSFILLFFSKNKKTHTTDRRNAQRIINQKHGK